MRSIKGMVWLLIKKVISFIPRKFRQRLIEEMVRVERASEPRDAVKWLLGIHDFIGLEIDHASIRWGDGIHIKHELMNNIHSFFYERVSQGAKVLDLGCGIGAVADSIARHTNAKVLGIDMNENSITFAKQKFQHPNLQFMLGDVFKDIPPTQTFDVIVLSSVLEHLERRATFLEELNQKFKPQKFLIRVPTFEQHYFKALKRELGLYAFVDPTHVLEYSDEVFVAEIEQAGLKIVYMETRWGDIWAECASQ
jgi:2-polyprenyl-3-methyl-5-hydroxy-6-metoxy-1,4-benzoquinol methylase